MNMFFLPRASMSLVKFLYFLIDGLDFSRKGPALWILDFIAVQSWIKVHHAISIMEPAKERRHILHAVVHWIKGPIIPLAPSYFQSLLFIIATWMNCVKDNQVSGVRHSATTKNCFKCTWNHTLEGGKARMAVSTTTVLIISCMSDKICSKAFIDQR